MTNDLLLSYLAQPTSERFCALVRSEQNAVFGAAWRVLGERAAAEDVTQELFMKVLDADWGKRDIRHGRGFLVSQAIGLARTRLRGDTRRMRREGLAASEESTGSDVVSGAVLREVRDAVLELPKDERECVELRYFGGLAASTIAQRLGFATRTVHERLQAARERLRARLSAHSAAFLLPWLDSELVPPTLEPSAELGARLEELAEGVLEAGAATGSAATGIGAIGYAVLGSLAFTLVVLGVLLFASQERETAQPSTLAREQAVRQSNELAGPTSNVRFPGELREAESPRTPSAGAAALPPATALLVHVRDESGSPVTNATLRITSRKLATIGALARLDEDDMSVEVQALLDPIALANASEFRFAAFPDSLCGLSFELCGLAPGYATPEGISFALVRGETVEVELCLPRPRRAGLRIVDAVTSMPIAGAIAFSVTELERRELDPRSVWNLPGPARATSDVTGLARVEGLGAGRHQFEVVATGYQLAVLNDAMIEDSREVRLNPAPQTGRLLVRVQDPFGEPIQGFKVHARLVASEVEHTSTTDVSGVATFEALNPDWYQIGLPVMPFASLCIERGWDDSSFPAKRANSSEEIRAGESTEVTLGFLPGSARWEVSVVGPDGAPLIGEAVSLDGPVHLALETDASGRCEFEQLPAGSWRLSVGDMFESFSYESREVAEGETRRDRIVLGSTRIEGRVVIAETGVSPARSFVMLTGECTTATHSDSDGRFVFERVPVGEYRVTCVVPGFASSNGIVRVESSSGAALPLTVELLRGGSVIVELHESWPAVGRALELRDAENRELFLQAIGGKPNVYRSSRLSPGAYRLRAAAPGRTAFEAEVRIVDGEDTQLTLE